MIAEVKVQVPINRLANGDTRRMFKNDLYSPLLTLIFGFSVDFFRYAHGWDIALNAIVESCTSYEK